MKPALLARIGLVALLLLPAAIIYIALVQAGMLPAVGLLTAWMGGLLAATAGCLSEKRTESGLWMLASLMGIIAATLLSAFVYYGISDFLGGKLTLTSPTTVDAILAAFLLGVTVHLCLSVIVWNKRRSPRHRAAGTSR